MFWPHLATFGHSSLFENCNTALDTVFPCCCIIVVHTKIHSSENDNAAAWKYIDLGSSAVRRLSKSELLPEDDQVRPKRVAIDTCIGHYWPWQYSNNLCSNNIRKVVPL
jgi:hypothetical protein